MLNRRMSRSHLRVAPMLLLACIGLHGCASPEVGEIGSARFAVLVPPPDSEFLPVRCGGGPSFDPAGDVAGIAPALDIVGNAASPAFQRALDATFLYLRVRVDGDPLDAPDDLASGAWGWAVSTTGAADSFDFMILGDGFGTDTVRWLENVDVTAVDDVAEVAELLVTDLSPLTMPVDYWHVKVTSSMLGGDADYLVTLGLPRTELSAAGVPLTTPVITWFGTGTGGGLASLNGDVACHNATGGGVPTLTAAASEPTVLDPAAAMFEPGGDLDMDGLTNAAELALGTDPEDLDSEDDGIPDGAEPPVDTDGDGLIDPLDPDSDADGLLDGTEGGVTLDDITGDTDPTAGNFVADTDPTTTTFIQDPDSDGDGLLDGEEDADGNGAVGNMETDPNNSDTDMAGIGDGIEVVRGTDPLDPLDDVQVSGSGGCSLLSPGSGPVPWAVCVGLLALLALAARSRAGVRPGSRSRSRFRLVVLITTFAVGTLVVVVPTPARAQVILPASFDIDMQRFKTAPGSLDILGVPSSRVTPHLAWGAAVLVHYAHRPLRFVNPVDRSTVVAYLDGVTTLDLVASFGFFNRLELGVAMPFVLNQASNSAISVSMPLGEVGKRGVGDLRIVPKFLIGWLPRVSLSALVDLSLPTGRTDAFMGHGAVTATPRLVGELRIGRYVRVAANFGVAIRSQRQLIDLHVGHALVFGIGIEAPFPGEVAPVDLLASVSGEVGLTDTDAVEVPVELNAAVRWFLWRSVFVTLGAGAGLSPGYGTPAFRLLGAFGVRAVSLRGKRTPTTGAAGM